MCEVWLLFIAIYFPEVSALPLPTALSCNKPTQNCTKRQFWLVQTVKLLKFSFDTGSDMTGANSSAWYLRANITSLVVWLGLLLIWTRLGSVENTVTEGMQPHVTCSGRIRGTRAQLCIFPRAVPAFMDVQTQGTRNSSRKEERNTVLAPSSG